MTTSSLLADHVPNHWVRSMAALPHLADHMDSAFAAIKLSRSALDEIGGPVPRGTEAALLTRLAEDLGSPYLGAETGLAIDPRNSALLTYILFNSNHLQEALHHVCHFAPVARPQSRIKLKESADHIDLIVDATGLDLRVGIHWVEFSLAAMLGAFQTAINSTSIASQVGLANSRRSGRETLSGIYGCSVVLNASENFLRFPKSVLNLPVRHADPGLLGHLTSYGEVLLKRSGPVPISLSEQVERHLLHGMAIGRPNLSATAKGLGMSERTLSRRLKDEGTSFRSLAQIVQLKLAKAFMGDPHLSLAEVAHLCGFADQSSFTQAYRKWTGQTPSVARSSLK
ncbi:HTH-type transcriptional regulator VirS [Falsiruegeria litorea R37]|uniref:HTH-type transcriptional regulator VirS n=1 Tax=Falsiruegeria litorea R37 TaxID=1200284 RepID=A0A1Y5SKG8_9RHOB|nr:AraC family transcriptional regulator [Falsiruegeria litorea]SLN42888.1 HTH-type transcriptional regulator VirS [Falsiruegeria litorea R37]